MAKSAHLPLSFNAQRRIAWGLLILGMLFYAFWLCYEATLRYTTFKATGFDLGNNDQAVWNTLHGRFFQFTNHGSNWYGSPIRLAQHVEPILLPISLLYLLAADPRTLLIFQTLALTSGAIPAFLLTRRIIPQWPLLAPIMAAAYLLTPSVIGENIFDFHAITLATPLFLYALLALTYQRYVWFVVACILAASCKEDMPLVMGLLGLLAAWKYKVPRLGLGLFVLGVVWFAIAFLVIIPHFNVGAKQSNFWYRYAALGRTPSEAVVNVLLHPWVLITFYFTVDRLFYLFNLLRSPGFLALLAPEWLIPTLPSLAINLLSTEEFQHSGVYHYDAAIVPFVIIASIYGIRRLGILWYGWRGEDETQWASTSSNSSNASPRIFLLGKHIGQILSRQARRLLQLAPIRRSRQKIQPRVHGWRQAMHSRTISIARNVPVPRLYLYCLLWVLTMTVLNYWLMTPKFDIFWADHVPGEREQRIEQILQMIPPDAVVSAGGNLNPHLSERQYITIFPELTVATLNGPPRAVEYVIVDLTNVSPESRARSAHFLSVLNSILSSQQFHILAQADGILLLAANYP